MSGYIDPRIEREQWRVRRADVEAIWLGVVLARLGTGTALTSDLAEAAGIKPGREYSRFLSMLERQCRAGRVRKAGKRQGRVHQNNVWQLVSA